MPWDEHRITYHDGCEMCGGTGKTPYTENLGFYCDECAGQHGDGRNIKGKWRPYSEADSSQNNNSC